jgi:hypothetical protein
MTYKKMGAEDEANHVLGNKLEVNKVSDLRFNCCVFAECRLQI